MSEGTRFVHWKAGYLDDGIVTVHTALANALFLTGYSPKRWSYGINTLMPKITVILEWIDCARFCYMKLILTSITNY